MNGRRILQIVMPSMLLAQALGQTQPSESSGVDGALVFATPGTFAFNPRSVRPQPRALAGNVFHFTSITIEKGVTLTLSAKSLTGPVFWLSQGPVRIEGNIILDGENGEESASLPSAPGAGGYGGGARGHAGYGPSPFVANEFLVPLVGGAGGAGGTRCAGGAGGGAILIASSVSMVLNGTISANGGSAPEGCGAGGGGAIRLVAPVIEGAGRLSAQGGFPEGGPEGGPDSLPGRVRLETLANYFTGTSETPTAVGKPLGLFLPPDPPASVRIVSVDGVAWGSISATINRSTPVAVVVEAHFIPPGTVIQLEFFSESGVVHAVSTTPLEGTMERSHATASVVFPSGLSHSQARVAWRRLPGK